jgi:hypothetical protein
MDRQKMEGPGKMKRVRHACPLHAKEIGKTKRPDMSGPYTEMQILRKREL